MAYGARPVPQNIMSVEFKLFDFMTVKQFLISFGLLLFCALLFWLLPSPWKLLVPILLFMFGGIIIFVPFNGEPFHEFLAAYMEAMISPQRRVWNKKGVIVKTAFIAAKKQEFGKDFDEDRNYFKFFEDNKPLTADQVSMDNQEAEFMKQNEQFAVNNPQIDITKYNAQGNIVSDKAIANSINLNNNTSQNQQQSQSRGVLQQLPPGHIADAVNAQNTISLGNISTTQNAKANDIDENEKDDEYTVKNYIFGSVEDLEDKPVNGAAVVVRQRGKDLEVIYTNQNGDFQTHYEFKEGDYTIYVNNSGKDFNEILIHHDPIDPSPILIHPKDYEDKKNKINADEDKFIENFNGDIFVGNYDAKQFDVGDEYVKKENVPRQEVLNINTGLNTQQSVQPLPVASNITTNNAVNSGTAQTSQPQPVSQKPLYLKTETVTSPAPQAQLNMNSPLPAVTTPKPLVNYTSLENSSSAFEQAFILIPNTINGEVSNADKKPISNVSINIYDTDNNLVRTVVSNNEGKFYSFSPLPVGRYKAVFRKDNLNFAEYILELDGNIIYPKLIQPIN